MSQIYGDGQPNNIVIDTKELSIKNGAIISTSLFGNGLGNVQQNSAGNILINATDLIEISGTSQVSGRDSAIFSTTQGNAQGTGGEMDINTNHLRIFDSGQINAVTASNFKGGTIKIDASTIELQENGRVVASSSSQGDAGSIEIDSDLITVDLDGLISARTSNSGNGGTITVNAPQELLITNGSELTVETSGAGKPGNIFIATPNLTIGKDAQLSATATADSTNTEGGGSITINTSNLDLTGKLGIFAETQGVSPAGTLDIQPYGEQTELNIAFTDTAILSTLTTASGAGGDINLTAPETINIRGEGEITAKTSGSGDAGDINFTSQNLNLTEGVKEVLAVLN